MSEDLKGVLFLDSAVAGEAAGLALGLLHVGTATEKATEMLAYAHDTQHEKVSPVLPTPYWLCSVASKDIVSIRCCGQHGTCPVQLQCV